MKPSLIIIGLGNPGTPYDKTRHNVGFQAVDLLAEECGEGDWKESGKFAALTCEARIVAAPVLLVKPLTYMNRSGESVGKLVSYYKLDPARQVLVICDDIDLSLGELRFREKGGAGTHNGMKSVIEHIGENFARLRIGVGAQPVGEDLATWILSVPPPQEREKIDEAMVGVASSIRQYVCDGAS